MKRFLSTGLIITVVASIITAPTYAAKPDAVSGATKNYTEKIKVEKPVELPKPTTVDNTKAPLSYSWINAFLIKEQGDDSNKLMNLIEKIDPTFVPVETTQSIDAIITQSKIIVTSIKDGTQTNQYFKGAVDRYTKKFNQYSSILSNPNTTNTARKKTEEHLREAYKKFSMSRIATEIEIADYNNFITQLHTIDLPSEEYKNINAFYNSLKPFDSKSMISIESIIDMVEHIVDQTDTVIALENGDTINMDDLNYLDDSAPISDSYDTDDNYDNDDDHDDDDDDDHDDD